jgi:hypothetical protein
VNQDIVELASNNKMI